VNTNQQFDPIVSVAMLPVLGHTTVPASSGAHTASVFVAAAQDPGEGATGSVTVPTPWERMRRRYWHYELDLTHHPVMLRFSLPASEEAFAFAATVTLLWAVRDPIEVALLGVRDLKSIIWTFLNQTLRAVSRQFGIEEIRAAEAEMRLVLDKHSGEIGFGLRLPMAAVTLRLDGDTEMYLSERVQTGRAGNLAGDRHDVAQREAEHEGEKAEWRNHLQQTQAEWKGRLEQAQAQHQRDLEMAQATHRRELDSAQADHARQIEQLNIDHETKIKDQRLAFYRNALGGGNHDVMVLQLIENPGDIGAVLRLIDAANDKHYLRSREILDNLLQHHLANASDVDGLTQHTIDQLRTALSAAAPRTSTVIEESVDERVRTEEKHTDRVIRQSTM
jgi:hypothetical protein